MGKKGKKSNDSISFIDNLSMSRKLLVLAGAILALAALMGALSLYSFININGIVERTATVSTEQVALSDELDATYNTMRTQIYRAICFGATGNIEQRDASLKVIDEAMVTFEEDTLALHDFVDENYGPESKQAAFADEFLDSKDAYLKVFAEVNKEVEAGNYTHALGLIASNQEVISNCVEGVTLTKESAKEVLFLTLDDINAKTSRNIYFTLAIFVLVMVVGLTVAMYMARKIAKAMETLHKNVEYFQDGEFNAIVNSDAKDEIGAITRSLVDVVDTIDEVINGVQASDTAYGVTGELCPQIDATEYKGSFNDLAEAVNHIFVTNAEKIEYINYVVEKIAKGDFDIRKKTFPGEQKAITESIFTCLANITKLNTEINNVMKCVAEGNVVKESNYTGIVVDTEGLTGEWENIVDGIESIVTQLTAPLYELGTMLKKMADGDLSARMESDYVGQIGDVKNIAMKSNANIQSYITEIEFVLSQLAQNKYNVTIEREYAGDFKVIRSSLLDIIEQLNSVMGEISDSASVIANSASASAETSVSLAEASTRQNQAITTLLQEIDNVIEVTKNNANSATEARNLSQTTLKNAESGNNEMHQMLTTINEISDASRSIGNIIGIIEDIAFQTNLLALNAAGEAARAGEHGKGFAVVAEEVRSLAGRSQTAALETKELINKSIEKVTEGTEKADSTSAALDAILKDITQVSELIESIAVASSTQATTITGFGSQVNDISDVANMNTSTSEESAAIAQEISAQSETLRSIVAGFDLKYELD